MPTWPERMECSPTSTLCALGSTVIGKGTKISTSRTTSRSANIPFCGQVGIAGSAKLGNYVVLAGQVGIAGH